MSAHDIIVIGTSAGGIEALSKLMRALPHRLEAALFVVLHRPATGTSVLAEILNRLGSLGVVEPEDHAPIENGTVYVAPADHHMLLEEGEIRVVKGPKENRHRPAIDPLFRSAALVYGPRVIGIVLTGALDDGTAGLLAIKQRGGMAVVQDPADAAFPSMPQNALQYVNADYCVPVAEIGTLLPDLVRKSAESSDKFPVSKRLAHEVHIAKMEKKAFLDEPQNGNPSVFSCPECGGVLWEVHEQGEMVRFRCRVGHAFSLESIQDAQAEQVEDALWTALKTLQESTDLSRRMARQARQRGQKWLENSLEQRVQSTERRANVIREVLMNGLNASEQDQPSDTQVLSASDREEHDLSS